MPPITLYFLQASRSIRVAWLLEELGLDYNVEFAEREPDGKAPGWFKEKCGSSLGKFPVLKDGALVVGESGAIVEYLIETYDKSNRFLPVEPTLRIQARTYLHASEGTFMLHALALIYAQWFMPDASSGPDAKNAGLLKETQEGMAVNVQKDLDWLESNLAEGEAEAGDGRKWLVGDKCSVADVTMVYSVDYILGKGLARVEGGEAGKRWGRVERWLEGCKETEGYRKAVQRSGYRL